MGVSNTVYQQKLTVSVPRETFKLIAEENYSKNELRVFLMLLTELSGYKKEDSFDVGKNKDPMNFKIIDTESIADFLDIKEKDVKKAIKRFVADEVIEKGSSSAVSKGYRFIL